MGDVAEVHAAQFLAGVAQYPLDRRVRFDYTTFGRALHNSDGGGIKDGTITFFSIARDAPAFAPTDVARGNDQQIAPVTRKRRARTFHAATRSVLAASFVLANRITTSHRFGRS